ncbi:unnamed protein product [Cunninghamella blakesleeana]
MTDNTVLPSKSENNNEAPTKDKQKLLAEKKKKRRERKKKKSKKQKKLEPKTKVVVRRLPPNLPEDIFMNTVKQWITDDLVDYKIYIPGKLSTNKSKESVFSRAYFHMKTIEAVISFHQGFDGHIFMDSKGNESRAVVEFSPYQSIPKVHKVPDARQGTIEEDPDYQRFLDSLKEEENKPINEPEVVDGVSQIERLENRIAMISAQTLATEQANKPKTTPLLDHLRAQKAAKAASKAKKKQSSSPSSSAKSILKKNTPSPSPSPKQEVEEKESNDKSKKPPRRNKKKFDKEKEKGGGKNNNKENSNSDKKYDDKPPKKFNKSSSSPSPANGNSGGNGSSSKGPSATKKDGSNAKPKRSRDYKDKKPKGESKGSDNNNNNSKSPPVIKILGRQDNSSSKTS